MIQLQLVTQQAAHGYALHFFVSGKCGVLNLQAVFKRNFLYR